ncbi:hypothetical protein ACLKA7_001930 [Drosophila subpalustris]
MRRTLKIQIKASKRQHFLDLCDPWGMAYKMTMKRLHAFRPPSPSCPQLMGRIVEQLFPTQEPMVTNVIERSQGGNAATFTLVTHEEIQRAARRIKSGKAPGPDGLPSSAIKLAMELQPRLFADVFNTCLKEGVFPPRWKKQDLVLIPKGNRPPDDPSAYRPICLLDSAGKALERVICSRAAS